jgi:hypothetical protein
MLFLKIEMYDEGHRAMPVEKYGQVCDFLAVFVYFHGATQTKSTEKDTKSLKVRKRTNVIRKKVLYFISWSLL